MSKCLGNKILCNFYFNNQPKNQYHIVLIGPLCWTIIHFLSSTQAQIHLLCK